MNKFIIAATLAAATLGAAPALADPPSWAPAHGRRAYNDEYDQRGRYNEPRPLTSRDRVWRGRDGRYYCKRSNGTTGLVIGAVGGALVGRTIDTRGDRTLGTLLGAAGGALLGREIDRSTSRCR
ncbi:MAG: glycine zipper 2TM domain-containing protein [Novosphingobium sp.]|nr:glycine zipper 2TM domain-containing protein [Novosphingobium sp.]